MFIFFYLLWLNLVSIFILRKLIVLLILLFFLEGLNRKKFEIEVYLLFVKYLREVVSKFYNIIYMGYICMLGVVS